MSEIIELAEQLLMKVKMHDDTSQLRSQLQDLPWAALKADLSDDDRRKAFWINIYNAYFLILRKERGMGKPDVFRKRVIPIGSELVSLDDVEHGILRRFRYKYGLGVISSLFVRRAIKEMAVEVLDYRIHFALNCGAESCPPIAFYTFDRIEGQLDLATQSFLESETKFDLESRVVHTTALFKWFIADFGGMKGIRKIYQKQMDKDVSDYTIKFKDYSWEENLDQFA